MAIKPAARRIPLAQGQRAGRPDRSGQDRNRGSCAQAKPDGYSGKSNRRAFRGGADDDV
jgi:hypothetical protein